MAGVELARGPEGWVGTVLRSADPPRMSITFRHCPSERSTENALDQSRSGVVEGLTILRANLWPGLQSGVDFEKARSRLWME